VIGLITEITQAWATSPLNSIVASLLTGAATNIIAGLGVGMMSTLGYIIIAFSIIGAFYFGGLYGIAIAAVVCFPTLVSVGGRRLRTPSPTPPAALPKWLRPQRSSLTHDKLDAVGNTNMPLSVRALPLPPLL